ncbi:MAG: hypothetical protein EPO13_09640 [Actinomycetota bacterium]|nr:MAG: hypothetical protein EPO13_09640 [Actinomycetota bacterium]
MRRSPTELQRPELPSAEPPVGRRRWLAAGLVIALVAGALVGTTAVTAPPAQAAGARVVTGWLPYWASSSQVAQVIANADLTSEISPFWYSTQLNGATAASGTTVTENPVATGLDATLAQLKATGVKIVPSVTDGTPARQMAAVLADDGLRAAHVQQLVDLAVAKGYDGIDLDYEKFAFNDGTATWASTRPAWTRFIADLATALHAKGKMLIATVPPTYTATTGYWVYDYAGMVAAGVDRVRVMAYDYSFSAPGPIAPLNWVTNVVAYAVTQIPSSKLQIGAPTYGYDWVRRDTTDLDKDGNTTEPMVKGTCPTNRPSSWDDKRGMTSAQVPSYLASHGRTTSQATFDPTYQESRVRYADTYTGTTAAGAATSCKVYREVWYADARSLAARAALVTQYNLAGIALWTLHGMDAAQWGVLRGVQADASTRVAVIAASADVSYSRKATVVAFATALGDPLPNRKALLYWSPDGVNWTKVVTGSTGADGRAVFTYAPKQTGWWRVKVAGGVGHGLGDTGRAAATVVRAKVSATVSSPRLQATAAAIVVPRGRPVTIATKVKPGKARQQVQLKVLAGTRWVLLKKTTTSASGKATFVVKGGKAGRTATYQVVAKRTAVRQAGASASFTVVAR